MLGASQRFCFGASSFHGVNFALRRSLLLRMLVTALVAVLLGFASGGLPAAAAAETTTLATPTLPPQPDLPSEPVGPPTTARAPKPSSVKPAGGPLLVATKPLDPFIIKAPDGTYSGFSVELWDEIATRNQWAYEWQWLEKVGQVVDTVQQGKAQVGIAGITITKEREAVVDFSHPMFNAGLQIAVGGTEKSGLRSALSQIFSPQLFKLLGILFFFIFAAGNIVYFANFRRRPELKPYRKGLAEGIWFAGKTLGSADFGDEEPRKPGGRLIALAWMFAGIIIIQYFTALTTTQLTVQKIEGSINGVQDLPGKRIVTVDGSTADKWLNEQGLSHRRVTSIEAAYPLLTKGDVEAIVYDAPVLLRWVATSGQGQARTVGAIFKPETYGIALNQGSQLREQVNATLLEMQNDGSYDRLYVKWFSN
jgi:polar amino acid transport system substrate-binding protein